jgi:cysteinyl-tRNA synthetase
MDVASGWSASFRVLIGNRVSYEAARSAEPPGAERLVSRWWAEAVKRGACFGTPWDPGVQPPDFCTKMNYYRVMSLPIRIFNTLSRSVEEFKPLEPGIVKVYCCGPTVYHFAHVGNFRAYLFEDLLVRTLRAVGYTVEHVMNTTDVGHLVGDADEGEDKMLVAMRREGKSSADIAQFYTDAFFRDAALLNITRPSIVCPATEHISDMIEMIKALEARGFTYQAEGNVYFNIDAFPHYSRLALLQLDRLEAGARVGVDSHKKNPHDFVLWFTRSKFEGQELVWDSPWGRGYPGWHIECSAMARKYLGDRFDIHCGGVDHIPVHHSNEIAQSDCACGHQCVNYWMHCEFLVNEKNEKIAKSSGGFTTVSDIVQQGLDPMALRFLCLGTSYRKQLAFSWDLLRSAHDTLTKLKRAVLALGTIAIESPATKELQSAFLAELGNDLNSSRGVALVWETLGSRSLSPAEKRAALLSFDEVLGLGIGSWREESVEVPDVVQGLLSQRAAARAAKQWSESDALRESIKSHGFVVEDKGGEQILRKL